MNLNDLCLVLSNNQSWTTKNELERHLLSLHKKGINFSFNQFQDFYGSGSEYILISKENTEQNYKKINSLFKKLKELNICTEIKEFRDLKHYNKSQYILFSDNFIKTQNKDMYFRNYNHYNETQKVYDYAIILNNNQFWLSRNSFNSILLDVSREFDIPLYKKHAFEKSYLEEGQPFIYAYGSDVKFLEKVANILLENNVILEIIPNYKLEKFTTPYKKIIRFSDWVFREGENYINPYKSSSEKKPNFKTQSQPEQLKNNNLLSFEKLSKIDSFFNSKIIGQEKAVQAIKTQLISQYYETSFNNFKKGPNAIFFFVGPTGVGKTELCKLLSEFLYNNKNINRFDMSEYQDESAVFKLIGAPNGYKNSESGGALTNALDKNPNAIILFDEIEKAHHSVFKLFLTMFDEGYFTSGTNKKYNISNNTIVLTSNIGANKINIQDSYENIASKIKEEVKIFFTYTLGHPEILGRIPNDNIITFNPISNFEHQYKILDISFNEFLLAYQKENVFLQFDKLQVYDGILANVDPSLGARNIVNEFNEFQKKFVKALFDNGIKPEDMKNIYIEFKYVNKEVYLRRIA